jgi:hypothetical protein
MAEAETTTLFLRGMPRRLVREAKAAAARDGTTLARWVSERLARAAGAPAAGPDELGDAMAWLEANRARLERRYAGQYVAIVSRRVIDHDADFDALARRVFARIGARPVFMPRMGETEVRIRSPRRVRS